MVIYVVGWSSVHFCEKTTSGGGFKKNPKFRRPIVYCFLFAKLFCISQKRANREEQDVVFNKDFGITRSDSIRTRAYDEAPVYWGPSDYEGNRFRPPNGGIPGHWPAGRFPLVNTERFTSAIKGGLI